MDQLASTLHAIFLCNQFSNGLNLDKSRKVDVNFTKFEEKTMYPALNSKCNRSVLLSTLMDFNRSSFHLNFGSTLLKHH